MTLPIYIAAHLVYGASMGRLLLRRMRAECEVVGIPLIVTLAPVCLATVPLGAVLLRYAGSWFLHGMFEGEGVVAFERFHLGLMLAVGSAAVAATLFGLLLVLAVLTRDRPRLANIPFALAGLLTFIPLVLDGRDVLMVPGTLGRWVFLHPAGLVSVAVAGGLLSGWLFARARTAHVMPRPRGPASVILDAHEMTVPRSVDVQRP